MLGIWTMRSLPYSKLGMGNAVFVVAALLAVFGAGGGFAIAESSSDEAYMTLLYGDEFLLGVRVLGRSIRDTGATKDMVALVSDGVSDFAKKLLEADGWIVKHISLVANPNSKRPKRFWGVYTKLKIFSMTSYRKVVYLDADTIVLKSIEDLFKCGKFCANLKHSERLNSGVMVVEPSETLYDDMMRKVTSLYSYTGGDQGFLNSYYADFPNAHIFEPNVTQSKLPEMQRLSTIYNADVGDQGFLNSYYADFPNAHIFEPNVTQSKLPEMQRLSTIYNADVGLYMLANKWMVNETELRVIHYTLGPLKPWDWWTAWLLKPVDAWQNVRENLRDSLPGTGGGRNPRDQLVIKILYAFPICVLLFYYYRSCIQMNMNRDMFRIFTRSSICEYLRRIYYRYISGRRLPYSAFGVASSSIANSNQQFSNGANLKLPAYLGANSVFICFMAAILSLALAFVLVPRQAMPWTGLLLMYEWTFTTFFISFKCYLHLIYQWGKKTAHQLGNNHIRADSSTYVSGKGHLRNTSSCDMIPCFYWSGMALLAVAAPLLPGLLGITALFSRLGLMVAGGIILAAFMTFASEHLAVRAFIKGYEDRESRTRNLCLMR